MSPDRRVLVVAPALLVLVSAAVGCGAVEERIDQAATEALDVAIEDEANRRLADAGVQLSAPVDCATDGDISVGALSGDVVTNCSAITVDDLPVAVSFDGTVSADGCDGAFAVVVDGRELYADQVSGAACGG